MYRYIYMYIYIYIGSHSRLEASLLALIRNISYTGNSGHYFPEIKGMISKTYVG